MTMRCGRGPQPGQGLERKEDPSELSVHLLQ